MQEEEARRKRTHEYWIEVTETEEESIWSNVKYNQNNKKQYHDHHQQQK